MTMIWIDRRMRNSKRSVIDPFILIPDLRNAFPSCLKYSHPVFNILTTSLTISIILTTTTITFYHNTLIPSPHDLNSVIPLPWSTRLLLLYFTTRSRTPLKMLWMHSWRNRFLRLCLYKPRRNWLPHNISG